jgi:hypothetical protein
MGILGPHHFFADQFGWNVFVFRGDFLAYPPSLSLTVAANLVLRFQDDLLNFQLDWEGMTDPATSFPLQLLFVFGRPFQFQHFLAQRGRSLRLLAQVPS